MPTSPLRTLVFALLFLSTAVAAQQGGLEAATDDAPTAPAAALPAPLAVDCEGLYLRAEDLGGKARHAVQDKRWEAAVEDLRAAEQGLYAAAGRCPATQRSIAAIRQAEALAAERMQAEARLSHQSGCQPLLDGALALDVQAASGRTRDIDPAEVDRLLAEAERLWSQATTTCQPPHRDRAERALAATLRLRAANADLLGGGAACQDSWTSANALSEAARNVWRRKRWEEAAVLHDKAAMAWEAAAEHCIGLRQQQAGRKRQLAEIDAHNASRCGPRWDLAMQAAAQLKDSRSAVASAERQQLSFAAERHWRSAGSECLGNPQTIARGNAEAIARERGTPLPDAPPQAAVAAVAAAPSATAPAAKPGVAVATAPLTPPAASASAAISSPSEDLKAGDTTYRGKFSIDQLSGQVSGAGEVLWSNGERFSGRLENGRRQGKGRFVWANGQRYEGDWVDDQPQGKGALVFPNGDRYEGSLLAGKPHGRGNIQFVSGDRYTGEFEQGLFQGQGLFHWKSGTRYEGEWQSGKKHGRGRITTPEGEITEGEFHDDSQVSMMKNASAER